MALSRKDIAVGVTLACVSAACFTGSALLRNSDAPSAATDRPAAPGITESQLGALRAGLPKGVPDYLNWNDTNRPEMLRRAAYLASRPQIMADCRTIQEEDRKRWVSAVSGVVLAGMIAASTYFYSYRRLRRQIIDQEAAAGNPAPVIRFNPANMVRGSVLEAAAAEVTSVQIPRVLGHAAVNTVAMLAAVAIDNSAGIGNLRTYLATYGVLGPIPSYWIMNLRHVRNFFPNVLRRKPREWVKVGLYGREAWFWKQREEEEDEDE